MRTLHQSQPRCTSHQHTWRRSAAAHARSAPLRRPVTASAFNFNFDFSPGNEVTAAPQPPTVFQLPRSARPLQSVLDAQAAAEAAQQQLLATGPLAEAAAAGNELVSSILLTYSTVQRLYHKAVLPFLERHPQYIDSFAGMAYEIRRDILGPSRTPAVQPGGSISEDELTDLHKAAKAAAVTSDQQADALFAGVLSALAGVQAKGDWHVLPDLVTMLTSDWFMPDFKLGGSDSSQGWLSALGNALGSSLLGAVRDGASAALLPLAKPDVVKLMLYSCLKPDQALDIKQVVLRAEPAMMETLCSIGGNCSQYAGALLFSALATLPATDRQELYVAELEMNSWRSRVHSYPFDTSSTWYRIGGIGNELRLAFYTAGFSESAYTTVMEHVGGTRPLDNWDPLLQLCLAYQKDPSFEKEAPGWNVGHATLLQLLLGFTRRLASATTSFQMLDELAEKDSVTVGGIAQSITAAQLACCAADIRDSSEARVWEAAAQFFGSICVGQYTMLYMDNLLKPFDHEDGGFAHLLYWLEVESMALQLAGGQVGEAAVSAARSIIDSVPHSVILARAALRCTVLLASKSTRSLFGKTARFVSPELQTVVLARSRPQSIAEIKALGGRLPSKMLSQVTSPYVAAGSSTPLSMQQAADMLLQQLLQPNRQPTTADIVQLLCATHSAGSELRAFDPALVAGFKELLILLAAKRSTDLVKDSAPLWFAAALAQLQIVEQARDSPVLANVIAGSGLLEEQYLRPYTEFMAAKRATCTALAGAVCQAGWSLQSSAAGAIADSRILTMGDSPSVCCRAILWALSSCIVGLGRGQDSAAEDSAAVSSLVYAVDRTVRAARQDVRVAAAMPAGYVWLSSLSHAISVTCKGDAKYADIRHINPVLQQLVSKCGGFQKLEPAMQAIVQAAATFLVECPSLRATSSLVMDLLPVVPLLTAAGYSLVLDQLLTGIQSDQLPSTLATAWSAAVSAATDLQLAVTPAFGKQRPNMPFLLQQLKRVWEKVADQPQLALAVAQPVIAAAGRLITQHGTAGTAGAAGADEAAAQLLDAVCSLLASSNRQPLSFAGVQQPVMQGVLALLQQHPELPSLQHLQAAVCAAVRAEVTAGSGSILEAAEQLAASGVQLSKAELDWAAVQGAAAAVGQHQAAVPNSRSDPELLLLYWSKAVLSSADAAPSSSVASAVVAAMAVDAAAGGGLTQQLLVAQPLPTAVLAALLQAAQLTGPGTAVLPQLLQHAVQNQQVQLLPAAIVPQLLQSALAAAVATPAAAVSFADCMQLLGFILQQQDEAAGVSAATAQLLLAATGSSAANQQHFEALVQQHSGSPAVSLLLCSMLQAACKGGDTEQGWQLFQLLQQCSQPSQQQLQVCSDLLVQQRGIDAAAATAADRIVSVWQHCCGAAGSSSAAIQQLSPTAQQAVLSALVAKGQSEQALLVAQMTPALLPFLASLWQQQQVQQEGLSVDTAVLLQALQMCVAAGHQHAAEAADTLTGLLLQQDVAGTWQDSDLPAQLVQLLCTHGKPAAALQLLPACLAGAGVAAPIAIAAAAGAVAKLYDTQQQAELLHLLAKGAKQGTVQDAISQALGQPAPAAAVGLLLRALRDSNPEQGLGQLLTSVQLQQLCKLVCGTAEDTGNSSTLFTQLPSVRLFADDCLSAQQLPGGVAAQLLNVLCRQHPELQPSAAAKHLGERAAPAHSSTGGLGHAITSEDYTAIVKQLVQVVADLCYSQLGSTSSQPKDFDALEAAYAEWVSALSPEAAAAALWAAWVHRGRGSAAAVPLLCLELYQRAKPSGDSWVFDLGLMAAAEAAQQTGNWHRGEGIIAAAAKAQQQSEGSKGSRHSQQWVPSWPAAVPALLSVLVHTKGVDAAATLLLREHEQGSQAKQQGPPATGRKGKQAVATTSSSGTRRDTAATVLSTLLSLSGVNSFLVAAVAVAASHQQEGSDEEAESAAQTAVQVAGELFKPQLVAVSMGTAGTELLKPGSADLLLDGTSWGCLAQLYGVLGDWQQLGNIVLAAARQQLPGVGPGGVQVVLAGAAAALNAAGRHVAAVQLLDGLIAAGVTAVSHPQLAQQLVDAADKSSEVEQELANRLEAGDEAIYEGLPDVAAAAGSGMSCDAVPAVQLLVVHDAAGALAQLSSNFRR